MGPARAAFGQGGGVEGQTAGPCAGAAVAAAPAQEGGHIALPAHAHAQRPVDEALGLDAAAGGDGFDLLQAELPRQDDPGKPQLGHLQRPLEGVDAHLGGGVPGQRRRDLPAELGRRHVLADDGVGAAGGHRPHRVGQGRQLAGIDGGVHGHMDLHPPPVAEAHRPAEALGVKIAGPAAGVEPGKAQVYRVRAAVDGGAEHLFTAHRGKDLDLCHSLPLSAFVCMI